MEPWLGAAPHRSPSLSVTPSPHHLSGFGATPRQRRLTASAAMKRAISGVSEELNAIASLNLDQAPTRRLVRAAFADVHRSLDHILFKVFISYLCLAFSGLEIRVGQGLIVNCFMDHAGEPTGDYN